MQGSGRMCARGGAWVQDKGVGPPHTRHHYPREDHFWKWQWVVHHPACPVGRAVEGAGSRSRFRMSGVDLGWFWGCRCSQPPLIRPIPTAVCRPWPRTSEGGRSWAWCVGEGRCQKNTDFAMSSTLNHRCSPVRGSPAPIDGSMWSCAHELCNVRVGEANGGPCSPCGQPHQWGPPSAVLGPWQLCPGGSNSALRPHHGVWIVLNWSADGACVLKAWGEPPGAGGGWNRRMLACMDVARVCVCPVHTNAREMTAWQGMGSERGARPYTQAYRALAQAQLTAPAPAPGSASSSSSFSSTWLGARAVHKSSSQ